jgi:hypothetical protein
MRYEPEHKTQTRDFTIFPCALNAASPKIDVAKFKDPTSVNRKYTIPLL